MPRLSSFPARMEGWEVEPLTIDKQFLGSVRMSEWVHRRYTKGEEEVTVFLGSDDRLDPRESVVSGKTRTLESGRTAMVSESHEVDETLAFDASIMRSPRGHTLVYHWRDGKESTWREMLRALLVLDRGPLRPSGRILVVRLSTPIQDGRAEEAGKTLDAFLNANREAIEAISLAHP